MSGNFDIETAEIYIDASGTGSSYLIPATSTITYNIFDLQIFKKMIFFLIDSVTNRAFVGNDSTAMLSRALRLGAGFRGTIPRSLSLGFVVLDANVSTLIDASFDSIQLNNGAVHAFSNNVMRLQSVTISRNATLSMPSNMSLTLLRNGVLHNDGLLRVVDSLLLNGALNQTRYGATLLRLVSGFAPLLVAKLIALDGSIRVAGVGNVFRSQYTLVNWQSPPIVPCKIP